MLSRRRGGTEGAAAARGLPPRRGPAVGQALAAELGTSPSTVGRAVQELARQGG